MNVRLGLAEWRGPHPFATPFATPGFTTNVSVGQHIMTTSRSCWELVQVDVKKGSTCIPLTPMWISRT
jgi:hypothetical protein